MQSVLVKGESEILKKYFNCAERNFRENYFHLEKIINIQRDLFITPFNEEK